MKLALWLAIAGLILFIVGLRYVDPAPPRRIVMATGAAGGAYRQYGELYRKRLAEDGITVELRETSGSLENLQLLRSGEVDVAFVQTGVAAESPGEGLVSLGSIGFEPLWIFYRNGLIERVNDLRGKRVATGDPMSGTRVLVHRLLKDNGLVDSPLEVSLGGEAAAAALREGRVDAACFVAAVNAPLVQSLLMDPALRLLAFDRAEAYAARYPWISKLILPEGVADFGRNIPDRDVPLVSAVTTIVAREDFHPAVTSLLIRTGGPIHGQRGVFEKAGQFPSPEFVDFPLSEDAQDTFKHGHSWLSRHLPFWVASAIERLAFLILPLLTLLIPLLRVAPPIYVWRTRRQIYRWYGRLVSLERELGTSTGPAQDAVREQISRLDQEVGRVKVPLSYMDELFRLRSHIEMVLRRDSHPAA